MQRFKITPYCSTCDSPCDIHKELDEISHRIEWRSNCCSAPVEDIDGHSISVGLLSNHYLWCQSFEIAAPINPNLED